jgi:hypothetical protein
MLASRSQSVFNIGELVKDLAKERRLLLDTNIPTELTLNLAVWLGKIILHRQHRCRLEPDRSKPPQFHGSVLAGEAVFDPPHIRERGVFVIRGRVIRCTGAPRPFGIGDQDQIARSRVRCRHRGCPHQLPNRLGERISGLASGAHEAVNVWVAGHGR